MIPCKNRRGVNVEACINRFLQECAVETAEVADKSAFNYLKQSILTMSYFWDLVIFR
jgi:hypothetical protein